jgi:hypothetical protein
METVSDVLEPIDEASGALGLYFNILSWNAYTTQSASVMLSAGDAAITATSPARDAIHYYPLIPRASLQLPAIQRIYLPVDHNVGHDAVGDIRASLRDGSLARIINAAGPEGISVRDVRAQPTPKTGGLAQDVLFDYASLSLNENIHESGNVYERNKPQITLIMVHQMTALRNALFGRSRDKFYMFPHLGLLLSDLSIADFERLFNDPLVDTAVSMRIQPILQSLKIDRGQQQTKFRNEDMFRVKKVTIQVRALWEKHAENSSFSGKSLTYWNFGNRGESKFAEKKIVLENPIVFAMPTESGPRWKAIFNVLVGIKSSETVIFVSITPRPGDDFTKIMNSESLTLTESWPSLFIVRPGVVPKLDLRTTTDDIDDIANFKPVIRFLKQ